MKYPEIGQLMIEILVGLGIITTALVVSLVAVTHATKLAREAKHRQEASNYAEQVIEDFRRQRDLDKAGFFQNKSCNDPCGTFGDGNMFTCNMTCSWTDTRVDLTVTISWSSGGVTLNVDIPTILTLHDL